MFLGKIKTSIAKILLPFFYNIFKMLKSTNRAVNYLNNKRSSSNNAYDFQDQINHLLRNEKLVALDVGSKGGFNSDGYFSSKYNKFFDSILVDPLNVHANDDINKKIINKGLWSSKEKRKLYILNKRPESSSMFEPNKESLAIYGFKKKDVHLFETTETKLVECDTISSCLKDLNIKTLDYLKIDTQGAEFEILKGLDNFRPLLIKCEVQLFPMYKHQSSWTEVVNLLNNLGYMLIDWKEIGSHATRSPVEMDMIFSLDILKEPSKKLIEQKKEKFISLLLIAGQIKILKEASKIANLGFTDLYINVEDKYFN